MANRGAIMPAREELHRLVDELPGDRVAEAKRLLRHLRQAEEPDLEPLSPAELDSIRRSLEQIRTGETISREQHRQRGHR